MFIFGISKPILLKSKRQFRGLIADYTSYFEIFSWLSFLQKKKKKNHHGMLSRIRHNTSSDLAKGFMSASVCWEASASNLQSPFTASELLPEDSVILLKPTRFFHQPVTLLVFPGCTSWSTVLPHTNRPSCWIRASRTSNICFPRWFCYCNSLAQKLGQGFGPARFPASPQCLHSLIRPHRHVCSPARSLLSY